MSAERQPLLHNSKSRKGSRDDENQQRQLSFREKILLILTCVFVTSFCILMVYYRHNAYTRDPESPPGSNNSESVCITPECVLEAAQIINDIDTALDPCEDFDKYICTNWRKNHKIPDGESDIDSDGLLIIQNKQTIRDILSGSFEEFYERVHKIDLSEEEKTTDKHNFEKVKNYFDSCMDESVIDQRGATPIYSILKEIYDRFPVDRHNVDKNQLTDVVAFLAGNGVKSLFEMTVEPTPKNSSTLSIRVHQSGLTLPDKQYYKQKDIIEVMRISIRDALKIIYDEDKLGSLPLIDVAVAADRVVNFEKKLAELSQLPEALRDPEIIYNPMTLSELTAIAPAIDWAKYIANLLPSNTAQPSQVIVSSPKYIDSIAAELLEKEDRHTLQAYFLWRTVYTYSNALSKLVRAPLDRLDSQTTGVDTEIAKPRWAVCLDEVNQSLGFMAGRYYIMDKFEAKTKEQIRNLAEDIKQVFWGQLHQLEWIDKETRKKADQKLKKLKIKIGYSDESPNVMSPASLSSYYGDLIVEPYDYFGNYLNARKFSVLNQWRQIGKPTDKATWWMNPQDADAYYRAAYNEVGLPAGILQGVYFGDNRPEYLVYGAIGAVIGHEITHGYDTRGRRYDSDGTLSRWWTNETTEEYEAKTQCFVKQYSNFTVTDEKGETVHLNGNLTLAENLADNGGLKQSFLAWKRRYDNDSKSEHYNNMRLPGLDMLTPEQLFFVSYARTYCYTATPAQARKTALTNVHSPGNWRINGVVQNSMQFAEAFKCPVGSPMNPIKKCDLW